MEDDDAEDEDTYAEWKEPRKHSAHWFALRKDQPVYPGWSLSCNLPEAKARFPCVCFGSQLLLDLCTSCFRHITALHTSVNVHVRCCPICLHAHKYWEFLSEPS